MGMFPGEPAEGRGPLLSCNLDIIQFLSTERTYLSRALVNHS